MFLHCDGAVVVAPVVGMDRTSKTLVSIATDIKKSSVPLSLVHNPRPIPYVDDDVVKGISN